MKIRLVVVFFCLLKLPSVFAQTVTTSPVIPRANEPVTITVDVTGTSLAGLAWDNTTNPVWIWTWIAEGCASNCDAPTNVNPASINQDAAKATRISTNPDKYQITFTPTIFFNKPESAIKRIGLKLKTKDWNDNKQTDNDRFVDFFTGFVVTFTEPANFPIFKSQGETLSILASASETSTLTLKINDEIVQSVADATSIQYNYNVQESAGISTVSVEANNGTQTQSSSFSYIVRNTVISEPRPTGIIDGINYTADATKVILSLWAPGKTSAYVIGDFTDWEIDPTFQMKKDGEHFWLELTGLTAGQEYGFQYLVDESLYLVDPYTDKVLDPDDVFIPESTYPNLKPYPEKARKAQWYFSKVGVFQTNQIAYAWQHPEFQKPEKEKLVIYELLIRDFFEEDDRNYQNLIDTLSYLKKLGINAIELMPIMEFNGNESWGYNPTFMFAPDKYYGTKNKLKEFIDKCHQNGMAVILDIVLNHQDLPNTYVLLDFDFAAGKPQADNKWFNVDAKHPFNVFFDMNHESSYSKKYIDTINHYWLNEFKVDGFRFDLSKGFTQVDNLNDVGAWSAYDASRVALLKRMADKIWTVDENAYVILEHLSVNSEEKELAEYRSEEGKGMMLWGKMTENYSENAMGYSAGSDLSWIYHSTRGWDVPHLVGYMESHDEERLMYSNYQNGKNVSGHNTKTLAIALKRMEAAATLFYTIPGPKMLWQFGELGYDFSINRCDDGTINSNCRLSSKPVRWDYRDDEDRYHLYQHIADLNRLRNQYDIFSHGTATLQTGENLVKQIMLKNEPYLSNPQSADDMNVVIAVNFDVTTKPVTVDFPHSGTWYDYYNGSQETTVANNSLALSLPPAGYRIFTDYQIGSPLVTSLGEELANQIFVYPIPVDGKLTVKIENEKILSVSVLSTQGTEIPLSIVDVDSWNFTQLSPGLYIGKIRTNRYVYQVKILKR